MLALVILGCRSCDTIESNKLAQSEIFQDYAVQSTKEGTSVSATFRVGGSTGTTIALATPSRVEYNGKAMSENLRSILSGTYYSASSDSSTIEHTFTYTNGEGTVLKNSVSFQPFEITGPPKSIDPRSEIVIPLTRGPGDGETLDTAITTKIENQGMTNSNSNNANSASQTGFLNLSGNYDKARKAIVIPANTLKNFTPGPAEIVVKISGYKGLDQKTRIGGAIKWSYTAPSTKVTIAK